MGICSSFFHVSSILIFNSTKRNANQVSKLYLGYNCFGLESARKLIEMIKVNKTLTIFDMQGVLLDLETTRVLCDALKHNTTLIRLIVDIDSTSNDVARLLKDALQSNTTLQDFMTGSDGIGYDKKLISEIEEILNMNKYTREVYQKKFYKN